LASLHIFGGFAFALLQHLFVFASQFGEFVFVVQKRHASLLARYDAFEQIRQIVKEQIEASHDFLFQVRGL
jgi:hypothetical protein